MNNSKKITMIMAIVAVAVMAIAAFAIVMPAENIAAEGKPVAYPAILHDNAKVNPIPDADLYTPDTYTVTVGDMTEDGCYPLTIAIDGLRAHVNGNGDKGYWFGAAFVAPAGADKFQYIWTDAEPNDAEWSDAYDLEKNVYDGKDGVAFYFTPDSDKKFVAIQWVAGELIVGSEYYEVTFDLPVVMYAGKEFIGQFATVKAAYDKITEINEPANDYTITLLRDCQSPAFGSDGDSERTYTIDLNGFELDITKALVGSVGYESQAIRVLPGHDVTLTKGTITSSVARMMINKYGDLTLDDVIIDGTKLDETSNSKYVLSNCRGTTIISGKTHIIANEGWYAFDVDGTYSSSNYSVTVQFDDTFKGSITGNIEYWSNSKGNNATLNINGDGDFTDADLFVRTVSNNQIYIYSGTFSDMDILKHLGAKADVTLTGIGTEKNPEEIEAVAITLGTLGDSSNAVNVKIENSFIDCFGFAQGNYSLFKVQTGSSLTLDKVVLRTDGTALYPAGNAASIKVIESDIIAGTYCVGTNANSTDNYNVEIELKNSKFTSQGCVKDPNWDFDDCTVMINVAGTLDIDNCVLEGNRVALLIRAGTATVTNSTIKFTAAYEGPSPDPWGSGNNVISKAIVLGNESSPAYKADAILNLDEATVLKSMVTEYAANFSLYATSDNANGMDTYLSFNGYEAEITGTNSGSFTIAPTAGLTNYAITIDGKVTITEDLDLNAGDTLTVNAGATLTIASGVTFVYDGTVTNNGTIVNYGTVFIDNVDELMNVLAWGGDIAFEPGVETFLIESNVDNEYVNIILNGNTIKLYKGVSFNAYVTGNDKAKALLTLQTKADAAAEKFVTIAPGSITISGTLTGDVAITVVGGVIKINGVDAKDTEAISGLTIDYDGDDDGKVVIQGVVEIPSGKNFVIEPDVIVEIEGTLSNSGNIVNGGTVTNYGIIGNSGTITINVGAGLANKIGADINNYAGASITNGGTLSNSGTVNNNSTATISNNAVLINNNAINNEGALNYNDGSTVEDSGVIEGKAPVEDGTVTHKDGATTADIVNDIKGGADVTLADNVTVSADAKSLESFVSLYNMKKDKYYTMTVNSGIELATTVLGKDAASAFINLKAGSIGYTISAGSVVITGSIDSGTITDVTGKLTLSTVVISGLVVIELDDAVATEVLLDDVTLTGSGSLVIVSANAGDKITVADMTVGGAAGFYIVSATTLAVNIGSLEANGTVEIGNDYDTYLSEATATITITGKLTVNGILDMDNEFAALGSAYITKIENNGSVIFDLDGATPVEGIEKMSGTGDVYVNNALIRTSGKNNVSINVVGELVVLQVATGFNTDTVAYWGAGVYTDGYSLEFPSSAYATYDGAIVRTVMVAGTALPSALPITTDVPNAEGWTINGKNYNDMFVLLDDGTTPFAPAAANYTVTVYIPKYTITWYDAEGYVIQKVTDVLDGTKVLDTYTGSKPVKEATAKFTYDFAGWNTVPGQEEANVDEDTVVTGADCKFYPAFVATINEYTISWIDGDGNVIGTDVLEYGETPVYAGADPTKTATESYAYTWDNGWTPVVVSVVADAAYTATFDATPRTIVETIDIAMSYALDGKLHFTFDALDATEIWGWASGEAKISITFLDASKDYMSKTVRILVQDGQPYANDVVVPDDDVLLVSAYAYALIDDEPFDICILDDLGTVFTITYYGNGSDGGVDVDPQYYTYGGAAVIIPECTWTKTGYYFVEWNTDPYGEGDGYDPEDAVGLMTMDVGLYAIWGTTDYDIIKAATVDGSFVTKIGDVAVTTGHYEDVVYIITTPDEHYAVDTVTVVDSVSAPVAVTKEGTNIYYFTMPADDVTVTVTFEANVYTITYDGNGATSGSTASQDYEWGTPALAISVCGFDKTGYGFVEWNTKADGSGTGYDPGDDCVPTDDITLYAIWDAVDYDITKAAAVHGSFDVKIGDVSVTTGNYEDVVYIIATPGMHYSVDTVTVVDSVSAPVVVTKEGTNVYYFTMPADDVTVTVTFEPATYTITYDGNDATSGSTDSQDYTYGDPAFNLRMNGFVKTGYTFSIWNTKADGTGVSYDQGAEVDGVGADMTLYAIWNANNYTVAFNANTGTGTMEDQAFVYDVAQALNANKFTKEGYSFAGWATSAMGDVVYADKASVSNLATSGTVTLYAKWNANNYTVAFNANGGTGEMEDQAFVYDVAQALNANEFEKVGYSFAGWATSAMGEVEYADEASVSNLATSGKVTLYAKWNANNYTVAFNANGGTGAMASQAFVYDVAQALNANEFTKEGYSFAGWATSALGDVVYADKASVSNLATSGTVDLYAKWNANNFTVVFDGNGATGGSMAPQAFVYDVAQALNANAFTKEGNDFIGWNTEIDGTGDAYDDKESVSNLATSGTVTLYAQWDPAVYNFKVYLDGVDDPVLDKATSYDATEVIKFMIGDSQEITVDKGESDCKVTIQGGKVTVSEIKGNVLLTVTIGTVSS